ncbi:MAG: hypothetical protein ACRBBP_08310 [Bdellovibrionales bacterium]
MRKIIRQFPIIFVSLLYTTSTLAVSYNYTTLIFKDYPDLKPLVSNALRESRRFKYPQDGNKAVFPLKKSLKMILSRPDSDNLVVKLSPELVQDLESMGVLTNVIDDLIAEGQEEVMNKALHPKVRATSLIMLNNLLLLIRPRTLDEIPLATSVCTLADKDLKIPKEVLKNTELTTMLKEGSPTNLAKKIMLWYAKQKNKEVQTSKKGCPFSKRA